MDKLTTTKRCSKCGDKKSIDLFYMDKRRKDGRHSACKACEQPRLRENSNRWRQDNRGHVKEYASVYKENHQSEINEYQRQYRYKNKNKISAYMRSYQKKNKEKINSINRRSYRKNPKVSMVRATRYRARKLAAGGSYAAAELKRQGDCQKWRCWWCGKDCKDKYHADHLVPLAKSGHNNITNIVIACPVCNFSKSAKLPSEWIGMLL